VVSFAIFGGSLVVLYSMSTLYHALTQNRAKRLFAVFDHSSIYLLIAGTYTPFCLTTLNGTLGWTIFGIIWGCALTGITLYSVFGSRMRLLSVLTYLPMGWLIVFAAKPMSQALPPISLLFLVLGGISYTVGCVFYALKKIKWMHGVWHLFVLAGSVFHFFSVFYIL
jgi:hemolysin III